MVKVKIPALLRNLTSGATEVEVAGANIADCLAELERRFPGIRERLLDKNGQLQEFVNIYINGEDIRFLEDLNTLVKPGDEITIIPAIAGG